MRKEVLGGGGLGGGWVQDGPSRKCFLFCLSVFLHRVSHVDFSVSFFVLTFFSVRLVFVCVFKSLTLLLHIIL